jgi:hypothetical protein
MCIETCPEIGFEHECHKFRRKHAGPLIGLLIKKEFYGLLAGHEHTMAIDTLRQKNQRDKRRSGVTDSHPDTFRMQCDDYCSWAFSKLNKPLNNEPSPSI